MRYTLKSLIVTATAFFLLYGDAGAQSCGCCPPPSGNTQGCTCNPYCLWECDPTPIILDLDGNGFSLTSADAGAFFDILANGTKVKIAWTKAGSDDAWLVLDRNNNGSIDDSTELFGDRTPQPPSPNPNGFAALSILIKERTVGTKMELSTYAMKFIHG